MARLNRVGNCESGIVRDLGVRDRNPSDTHFEVKRLAPQLEYWDNKKPGKDEPSRAVRMRFRQIT